MRRDTFNKSTTVLITYLPEYTSREVDGQSFRPHLVYMVPPPTVCLSTVPGSPFSPFGP